MHGPMQICRSTGLIPMAPEVPHAINQLCVAGALFHGGVPKKNLYSLHLGVNPHPKTLVKTS